MKKNNKITKSLDLSFAHGTATLKCLQEFDPNTASTGDNETSGDTTIRAITSFYTGTRRISWLDGADSTAFDPYDSTQEPATDKG